MQEIVDDIRNLHKQHCLVVKQRMGIYSRLSAYIRYELGWDKDLPEKERKKIETETQAIIDAKTDERFKALISITEAAASKITPLEDELRSSMEKLAKRLPVWISFGKDVKGFGLHSLAVIIGEAGNLSGYPDFPHLWKRLGLAVMDGIAQGKLPAGTHADVWIAHGYKPERRAKIHVIGENLLRKSDPKYKLGYYDTRKVLELDRTKSLKHAHLRSMRYMEKMFIKHLWQAWNGLPVAGGTTAAMSKDQLVVLPPVLV